MELRLIIAFDITYVPAPTSIFYIADAGNSNINYGTINTGTLTYTSLGTYQISQYITTIHNRF